MAFDIVMNPAKHIAFFFFSPSAVQMEKMEQMKEESQENHLLCCFRLLLVKWNILMTGRKLMLLGNGQEHCQVSASEIIGMFTIYSRS